MHTDNATAAPEPRAEVDTDCCICHGARGPLNPRKLCAIWRDGRMAHADCYNGAWLSVGIADKVLGARGVA